MKLLPHRFEIPGLGSYPGFHSGDGRALFNESVAARIAEDWTRLASLPDEKPRTAEYDAATDHFRFFDPATEEWLTWGGIQVGQCKVYPIGEGAWSVRG